MHVCIELLTENNSESQGRIQLATYIYNRLFSFYIRSILKTLMKCLQSDWLYARSFDFEITSMNEDQIALHSVQLSL